MYGRRREKERPARQGETTAGRSLLRQSNGRVCGRVLEWKAEGREGLVPKDIMGRGKE